MTKSKTKQIRYSSSLHIALSYIGFIAFIISIIAAEMKFSELILFPNYLTVISLLITIFAIYGMYFTRKSDEWITALWSAGANAGFIGTVAWIFLAPVAAGVYHGLTDVCCGDEIEADDLGMVAPFFGILCFFIAYFGKRILGR